MITIANVGLGNFVSVANMYKFLEIDVEIISDPRDLSCVTHLILPGVGAFDSGMRLLSSSGWRKAILDLSQDTKILGICLGMHLLTNGSEEGKLAGLGLIGGECQRIPNNEVSVPHIGWNEARTTRDSELIKVTENNRFYFSHSYFVALEDFALRTSEVEYGVNFTSSFENKNVFGVQFHPEKSHKFGMRLFRRFAELT